MTKGSGGRDEEFAMRRTLNTPKSKKPTVQELAVGVDGVREENGGFGRPAPRFAEKRCGANGDKPLVPRVHAKKELGLDQSLLQAVVRSFFGDDYVVDVAFFQAGGGDSDETGAIAEILNGGAAAVAHAGS